jgi:alpha-tubulin suppressor-like RCC1 family protein
VAVTGGLTFRSVSAGRVHTCGLSTAGTAHCWGFNRDGQLGDGTTTASATPRPVSGGLTFASIEAGGTHTCELTTVGAAYCWGDHHHGALGDGTTLAFGTATTRRRVTPVRVQLPQQ